MWDIKGGVDDAESFIVSLRLQPTKYENQRGSGTMSCIWILRNEISDFPFVDNTIATDGMNLILFLDGYRCINPGPNLTPSMNNGVQTNGSVGGLYVEI